MTYDSAVLEKTIGKMSDEELLKRLHLNMFTEYARAIAEAEVATRKLDLNGAEVEQRIEQEAKATKEHKSQKYINLLTLLAGAAGATQLGILGGIAFLVPGRWVAKVLDRRLASFPVRLLGGIAVLLIGVAAATVLQFGLAFALGWQRT